MENLKKECIKEINKRYEELFKKLETADGIKDILAWERKKYTSNVERKTRRYLEKRKIKEIETALKQIEAAENAPDFTGQMTITIEWKPSRMWRSNPKAYTNFGFEGQSIGGCGYDKKSTASAEALNSHLPLLKLLYLAKDKLIKEHSQDMIEHDYFDSDSNARIKRTEPITTSDLNRKYLGYGSGYRVIPCFEGGVGVSCHQDICKGLGLDMAYAVNTSNTDVFIITKKDNPEGR